MASSDELIHTHFGGSPLPHSPLRGCVITTAVRGARVAVGSARWAISIAGGPAQCRLAAPDSATTSTSSRRMEVGAPSKVNQS